MRCVVLLCFVLFWSCESQDLPKYIHKCHRSDPHVTKCIKNSVENIKPHLKTGIPDLDVPPLEPFRIPEVVVSRGDGPTHFMAILRDIDITGASDFVITKLKLDIPNYTYRVGIKIPALKLDGNYDVDARILVVPIKGSGKFAANATEIEGQAFIKGELRKENGKELMDFTELNLKLKIDKYHVHLDNLFQGDPVLSEAANEVLNQSNNDLITLATPFIERKASEILLDIAKKIVKNVEYDEAFPQ